MYRFEERSAWCELFARSNSKHSNLTAPPKSSHFWKQNKQNWQTNRRFSKHSTRIHDDPWNISCLTSCLGQNVDQVETQLPASLAIANVHIRSTSEDVRLCLSTCKPAKHSIHVPNNSSFTGDMRNEKKLKCPGTPNPCLRNQFQDFQRHFPLASSLTRPYRRISCVEINCTET